MNHLERVKLALHMMQMGKSDNKIVKRFSLFEDFNKHITKIQISNLRRMRRGY